MSSNCSPLTYNRYFRVMGLACTELISTVPLALWLTIRSAMQPIYTWRGLGNLHYDFSRVDQWPSFVWLADETGRQSLEYQCWITVAMPLVFFAFFGFTEEAMRHYKSVFSYVIKPIPLWPTSPLVGASNNPKMSSLVFPSIAQHSIYDQNADASTDEPPTNTLNDNTGVVYDDLVYETKAGHTQQEHFDISESGADLSFEPSDEKALETLELEGDDVVMPESPPMAYIIDLERRTPDRLSFPSHTVDMV